MDNDAVSGVDSRVDCCSGSADPTAAAVCPGSGGKGVRVEARTVKALLSTEALGHFEPGEYRFCPDAQCDIVYFDASGRTFSRSDLRVPVWQKEAPGARLYCYCFGESDVGIRAEIARSGQSLAVERVTAHVRARRCACDVRNPRGTCCLGDLVHAVTRLTRVDRTTNGSDHA